MPLPRLPAIIGLGLAVAALLTGPVSAQAPQPAPVESVPLPPPGATPEAPAAPGQAAPAAPSAGALPTLIPTPGDPVDVDDVTIPAKPAAVLSGTSTWDDGFASITKAFERVHEELKRAGIPAAGRPVTVFVQTDDLSFRYEAMVPIAQVPEGRLTLGNEVRFGVTPSGKALRFVHKGPYDDIDSTYETITAYLDAKGVIVKDVFIEEYATDPKDSADPNLEINIFAVPK